MVLSFANSGVGENSEGIRNVLNATTYVVHYRSVWRVCGVLVDLKLGQSIHSRDGL